MLENGAEERNSDLRLDTYLGLNGTVLDLAVLGGVSERGYVGLTAGLQPRGGEELRRRERRPDDRAGRQLHFGRHSST